MTCPVHGRKSVESMRTHYGHLTVMRIVVDLAVMVVDSFELGTSEGEDSLVRCQHSLMGHL